MKKVILTKGLPASGKSTWAREILERFPGQFKRVNKDDLRAMLDGGKWSKDNEKFVLAIRDHIITESLKNGKHVIVDDTNLHDKHKIHIKELVGGHALVETQSFDTPIDECIERDRKRANGVGEKIIRDMHRQFMAPKVEPVEWNKDLSQAVICDIDGTLAKMDGRGPFDTSKYDTDKLNEDVAVAFDKLSHNRTRIIVSGRSEEFRAVTEAWLAKHSIRYNHFYMRPAGDTRKDFIVKQEIFDREIRGKYNIFCVLDDRNQVVAMWRSLGLTVFQVADGNF